MITPYDVSLVPAVEDALRARVPSLSFSVSGTGVRATAPEVTGEQRARLERVVKDRAEDAKRSVRAAREKVLADIKRRKSAAEISEDEEFSEKKGTAGKGGNRERGYREYVQE